MNQELRDSFSLILKRIMGKNDFDSATKDEIEDAGWAMMQLKMIAEHFCGADQYEMLALVINASRETDKVDVDEHIKDCKLIDIWHEAGLDLYLLDKK
jgi:hypothetical protein